MGPHGRQLASQVVDRGDRIGSTVAEHRGREDRRLELALGEPGEEQLADRGAHGGQGRADLDVGGHEIRVAQPDEIEDPIVDENGKVDRLAGIGTELLQQRRGDSDEIEAP